MHLDRYADRRARNLSLGNKQRLGLARALLHQPELLILDEPANGLDPAGIVEIRNLLRRLADERGVTVFLSSHVLSEIAQLADRIGIIHEGRMVEDLTREQLHRKSSAYLAIRVSDPERAVELLCDELSLDGVQRLANGDIQIQGGGDRAAEIARLLVTGGFDLSQITQQEEDLEHYFMRLTGGGS
jgi:ABC-type multidrug transport system ATPase subunit